MLHLPVVVFVDLAAGNKHEVPTRTTPALGSRPGRSKQYFQHCGQVICGILKGEDSRDVHGHFDRRRGRKSDPGDVHQDQVKWWTTPISRYHHPIGCY